MVCNKNIYISPNEEKLMASIAHLRSFGHDWEEFGNLSKSEAKAMVGGISQDEGLNLGLTAMLLRNIRYGYGEISVGSGDEEQTPVKVYNAFGESSFNGRKVWISQGLAEKMDLRVGDDLVVYRTIDENGRLRYKCENQTKNPFGMGWGKVEQPAEGIVAAIDEDGSNFQMERIGLSAMQLDNLGVERESSPLNAHKLMEVIEKSEEGLRDGQKFGFADVQFGENIRKVEVYNAFGMKSSGGCGVRASSALADELGLELGSKVRLYIVEKKGLMDSVKSYFSNSS